MRNDFGVSEWTLIIPVALIIVTFLVLILTNPVRKHVMDLPYTNAYIFKCDDCGKMVAAGATRSICHECNGHLTRIFEAKIGEGLTVTIQNDQTEEKIVV